MNVTVLRHQLEVLERNGYGRCEVEIFPDLEPDHGVATYLLDFACCAYRVCAVRRPGPPGEGVVALHFDEAAAEETQARRPGRR